MLIKRFFNTSYIPCGAERSEVEVANVSVIGKILLAITATIEARNVLNIYIIITVLITPPWLLPDWQSELITKKNTKRGAIAFKAPTNTSPNREINVALGTVSPKTMPTIRQIIIL